MNLPDSLKFRDSLSAIITSTPLLVGFGIENRSLYNFIKSILPEMPIAIADKTTPSNIPSGAITYFGPNYLDAVKQYSIIGRAPGVPLRALGSHPKVITATQLFFYFYKKPIIGVTGTKGKSTTSSLIFHLLSTAGVRAQLLGNIGTPILEGLTTDAEVSVVELSSFHLEDLKQSPSTAVLLDIAPEHLDHHGSIEEYINAKLTIAQHQKPHDLLIAHQHHASKSNLGNALQKVFIDLSPTQTSHYRYIDGEIIECTSQQKLVSLTDTKLVGEGNVINIIAALEAVRPFHIPQHLLRKALISFSPLPHRLEPVGEYRSIRFYNDSLCTVPEALRHALNAFGSEVQTIIVGGFDRGISFEPAGRAIAESNVENIIYFPTTGEKILRHALSLTTRPLVSIAVDTMHQAVTAAYRLTTPGRICLLSPASPSFSVFKDYADRGEQFKTLVRSLN